MQHVFIIGAKGLGNYGGYETFLDKLTEYHEKNANIKYHIACKGTESAEHEYHGAHCFQIKVPDIGAAQAIYYDIQALNYCCTYIEKYHIQHPIIYVLACRIGPFANYFKKRIHTLGGWIWCNPDGHEWKRAKWSWPVRQYWKLSEKMMVKHVDLVVCDSKHIEKYIHDTYSQYQPDTTFIAYGAESGKSKMDSNDPRLASWYQKFGITAHDYYVVICRLVPENNIETIIREFMKSATSKALVIIATENKKMKKQLELKLHYESDARIKFVGTIYDQEMLKTIRENAYGYFHGHEVGGTNPSLLEALGSTNLNLLLQIGFNEEVAEDAALYWTKEEGNLASLIDKADHMMQQDIEQLGEKAKERIVTAYSWESIAQQYEILFCSVV